MDEPTKSEAVTTVDPSDRETLRAHLERFAGVGAVSESNDGTLTAEFSASTFVSVTPDGHVRTGMPLHGFDASAESLQFDHAAGELHVSAGEETDYTFRQP